VGCVFFTVEALHRDRTVKMEPLLWSTPVANLSLVLPKWIASVLVAVTISMVVAVSAASLQFARGHGPVAFGTYVAIYVLVLLPSFAFTSALATLLAVRIREKHVAYAILLGLGTSLYYLYGMGHSAWWYNPWMYQRWAASDFQYPASAVVRVLPERAFWLAVSALFLYAATIQLPRRDRTTRGRITTKG
jgi:hypothetical protein